MRIWVGLRDWRVASCLEKSGWFWMRSEALLEPMREDEPPARRTAVRGMGGKLLRRKKLREFGAVEVG